MEKQANSNHQLRTERVNELIPLILTAVNLGHIKPSDLNAETQLAGNAPHSLGLDSVDILEVVVVVEHRYGVKIKGADLGKKVFQNFGTIADFINSQK